MAATSPKCGRAGGVFPLQTVGFEDSQFRAAWQMLDKFKHSVPGRGAAGLDRGARGRRSGRRGSKQRAVPQVAGDVGRQQPGDAQRTPPRPTAARACGRSPRSERTPAWSVVGSTPLRRAKTPLETLFQLIAVPGLLDRQPNTGSPAGWAPERNDFDVRAHSTGTHRAGHRQARKLPYRRHVSKGPICSVFW
jgi:hypothetical protein